MVKPLHRDDVPYEIAEEIVGELKRLHPGHDVRFAGDMPADAPQEVQQQLQQLVERLSRAFFESMLLGWCFDCGAVIPGEWPIVGNMPDGWVIVGSDDDAHLQCPACDAGKPGCELTNLREFVPFAGKVPTKEQIDAAVVKWELSK